MSLSVYVEALLAESGFHSYKYNQCSYRFRTLLCCVYMFNFQRSGIKVDIICLS